MNQTRDTSTMYNVAAVRWRMGNQTEKEKRSQENEERKIEIETSKEEKLKSGDTKSGKRGGSNQIRSEAKSDKLSYHPGTAGELWYSSGEGNEKRAILGVRLPLSCVRAPVGALFSSSSSPSMLTTIFPFGYRLTGSRQRQRVDKQTHTEPLRENKIQKMKKRNREKETLKGYKIGEREWMRELRCDLNRAHKNATTDPSTSAATQSDKSIDASNSNQDIHPAPSVPSAPSTPLSPSVAASAHIRATSPSPPRFYWLIHRWHLNRFRRLRNEFSVSDRIGLGNGYKLVV